MFLVNIYDSSRRNETRDTVERWRLLYEIYPILDAKVPSRSIRTSRAVSS